jgi:SCP-2 sterol transfer family
VAQRKFRNKTVKPVSSGLRPRTIASLVYFMPLVFQPNQARGLDATYHFSFTGAERRQVTVVIKNRTIDVQDGLLGRPDVRITADSKTWLGYLAKEKSLPLALLTGKVRLKGNPRLLLAFGKCFPSAGPRHPHVEVLPQQSRMNRAPAPYQKNDPVTGKIRWRGTLVLAGVEVAAHDVKTFKFAPTHLTTAPVSF